MKVQASSAIASMLSGTWPVEAPTPRLSKVMTWRFRGDGVDDPRVPVVQGGGEVDEEDDGDAALRSQLAVGVGDAAGVDGAGGRVRVDGDDWACCAGCRAHDVLLCLVHGDGGCGQALVMTALPRMPPLASD